MINSQKNGLVYSDIYIYMYTQPSTCKCSYCIEQKTYIKNYENEVVDIINVFWFEMLIQTLSD